MNKDAIDQYISIELSGKKLLNGKVIDVGSDLLVLYKHYEYLYIPFSHIQHYKFPVDNEDEPEPIEEWIPEEDLSLRKVLTNARGRFSEIYVTGNQPLHGYITQIMNDYFVFYSPVFKNTLVSIQHLKWVIPYTDQRRPYGLDDQNLPVMPSNVSFSRTFDVQLKKYLGKLIVCNLGDKEHYIGTLKAKTNHFVVLQNARCEDIYLQLSHIKTVHLA
jgi:hypothetical protein